MFDGQSLGYTPFVLGQSYPYKFMATKADVRFAVANLPGTTYAERLPSIVGRVDNLFASGETAVLIDDGGTHDIESTRGNMTSAQALAAKAAYTAARRAAGADYIVGLTIPPSTTLTAGEETNRLAVNAALVADPAAYGYDEIVDVAAITQLQNANDAAYYYDGTHWTDAATTLVAQALVDAGI